MKSKYHSIWPFALVIVIFAASSQPSLATPKIGFSYDKLVHFLVFGLLATAVLRIPFLFEKRWKGVALTVLIVSTYGVIDELRQMFTTGRSVEIEDWIADTSGGILASVLYLKWKWYRQLLEKSFVRQKAARSQMLNI